MEPSQPPATVNIFFFRAGEMGKHIMFTTSKYDKEQTHTRQMSFFLSRSSTPKEKKNRINNTTTTPIISFFFARVSVIQRCHERDDSYNLFTTIFDTKQIPSSKISQSPLSIVPSRTFFSATKTKNKKKESVTHNRKYIKISHKSEPKCVGVLRDFFTLKKNIP